MHRTLIALAILLASSPAFAQTAPEPAPDAVRPPSISPRVETEPVALAPVPRKRSYAWQIMLADAGAFAFTGGFGWFVSGAIVHAAHGHVGRAVGSVLLRVGAPLAGALVGASSAECSGDGSRDDDNCGFGEVVAGALLGALIAEIVDIAIANDTVYDSAAPGAVAHRTRRGVTPVVQARDGHVGLGLSGRF